MAKSRRRRKPTKPETPQFNGDHGTGTRAANADTELVPITNEDGSNPNNIGHRRRVNHIDKMTSLSMRQLQAAKEIENAWCQVQSLSSGSPLKEYVQASPKPDEVVAHQVDAQSRLNVAMAGVPPAMRYVVEHLCWHNRPVSSLGPSDRRGNHKANLKVALDLAANKLRY
jgi:hypothetical protein